MPPLTLILCPLEIERRAAERAARGRADIRTTGPGPDNMRRSLDAIDTNQYGRIVLFGVAGGLCRTETAPPIGAVIDGETGRRWSPTCGGAINEQAVCIVGVDAPVLNPSDKRTLRDHTGADLVDTESHVFASRCAERALEWAIIRGVSDGPNDELPACVNAWIDRDGKVRPWRVARDLILHPSLGPKVNRLGRSTRFALDAASVRLDALLSGAAATIAPA